MECKEVEEYKKHYLIDCINRNIVECKDEKEIAEISDAWGINRNIVECKANCFKCPSLRRPIVLIETLWNVKNTITKPGSYFYTY